MADKRKLQAEVDRVLKKVSEGVEEFEVIWEKVSNASNANQKEKYEADLKKEIKKLQRLRDQIKTWLSSNDIKDKKVLLDTRKLIETQMERFRAIERETKTKAYSKEGLEKAAKLLDANEKKKAEVLQWLSDTIDRLQDQVSQFETEMEALNGASKKKKGSAESNRVENGIKRHKFHVAKLEQIQRLVHADVLAPQPVKDLEENVEYYIDSCQEPDFVEDEGIYEELQLDELDAEFDVASDDSSISEPEADEPPAKAEKKEDKKDAKVEKEDDKKKAEPVPASPVKKTAAGPQPAAAPPPASPAGKSKAPATVAAPAQAKPVTPQPTPAPAPVKPAPAPTPKAAPVTLPTAPPPKKEEPPKPAAGNAWQQNAAKQAQAQAKAPATATPTVPSMAPPAPAPEPEAESKDKKSKKQAQAAAAAAAAAAQPDKVSQPTPAAQPEKAAQPAPAVTLPQPPVPQAQLAAQPQAQAQPAPAPSSSAPAQQAPPQPQQQPQASQQQQASAQPPVLQQAPAAPQQPLSQPPTPQPAQPVVSPFQPPPALPQPQQPSGPVDAPSPLPLHSPASEAWKAQMMMDEQLHMPHLHQVGASLDAMGVLHGSGLGQQSSLGGQSRDMRADSLGSADMSPFMEPGDALGSQHLHHPGVDNKLAAMQMLDASYRCMPEPIDSERTKIYIPKNPYPTPAYYPQVPSPMFENPAHFDKFDTDTLFFIFYYQQGTYQQYLAARELKKQSWRFHKKYLTWFQRHDDPKDISDEYEQGTYVYFDYETGWCQRKKSEFTFEYRYLEDQELP